MSDDVTMNTKKMDDFIKALEGKLPSIRVGVLGGKTIRHGATTKQDTMKSNAEIGLFHEFGTTNTPRRSFLRQPIQTELPKRLESANAFSQEQAAKVIQEGSIVPWLKRVAFLAEQVVLDAFDTAGFGRWKASDMTHKKVKQTLVETQQLRNSITSDVR